MRQREAVERVRQSGGHATFEYEQDSTSRHLTAPMPPEFLRWLTGNAVMSDVIKVSWHSPHAGAVETQVLSNLTKLKDLRLNLGQLTDDGIRPVGMLTELRRLDIWCGQITDQAMPHLSALRQLRTLDLYSTQVTDAGLEHLRELQSLEVLKLRGTNVTPQGVAKLKAALPNCKVLGVED
jgi:hypothetical protein